MKNGHDRSTKSFKILTHVRLFAWLAIPSALRRRAGILMGEYLSQQERVSLVLAFTDLKEIWKFYDGRRSEIEQDAVDQIWRSAQVAKSVKRTGRSKEDLDADPRASREIPVTAEPLPACPLPASDISETPDREVATGEEECQPFYTALQWRYSVPAAILAAWIFSPVGGGPALILLVLVGRLVFLTVNGKPSKLLDICDFRSDLRYLLFRLHCSLRRWLI